MPAGWPPASVPSAFTTRTSTPSASPVQRDSVPPRSAARSPSAPSAWPGSADSFCQPDQRLLSRSLVRTSAVPRTGASGSSQVTSTALNRSVSRLARPLRPEPLSLSFTVWTAGLRLWDAPSAPPGGSAIA
ncbi:hypothetical protein SVIOM74S_07373 [Streptomyces violarus]